MLLSITVMVMVAIRAVIMILNDGKESNVGPLHITDQATSKGFTCIILLKPLHNSKNQGTFLSFKNVA